MNESNKMHKLLPFWCILYTLMSPYICSSDLGVDSNCLDATSEEYASVACQCQERTCVNACCDRGQVMNIQQDGQKLCAAASDKWEHWRMENDSLCDEEQKYIVLYDQDASNACLRDISSILQLNITKVDTSGFLIYGDFEEEPGEYCMGVINYDGQTSVGAVLCSLPRTLTPDEFLEAAIHCTLFAIGAVFLLATLVVYAMLAELRHSVQGLSLVAHCACMFIAYLALILVKARGHQLNEGICHFVAYLIQYTFLAAIFWINVMCIDISTKFRSLQNMMPARSHETRKFSLYAIYAMGVPFVIFIITVSANSIDAVPMDVKPNIGYVSCWLPKDYRAIFIYFYGPMGLLLLFNTFLFIFTAVKIFHYSKETSNLNRAAHQDISTDRARFLMFIKLFGLMGLPWITEIVSWFVGGTNWMWYITDAINILRSVFIFFIFCCKRRIWDMMQKKYPQLTRVVHATCAVLQSNPNRRNTNSMSHGTADTPANNTATINMHQDNVHFNNNNNIPPQP